MSKRLAGKLQKHGNINEKVGEIYLLLFGDSSCQQHYVNHPFLFSLEYVIISLFYFLLIYDVYCIVSSRDVVAIM